MSDACNSLREFIKDEVSYYVDKSIKPIQPVQPVISEDTILVTPHWDNMLIPDSTRIHNGPQGLEFHIESELVPGSSGSSQYVRYPGTRVVLNDVIPMYTPINNIEELVITVKNLANTPTNVTIRLETVRRIKQGFANYVTLLTRIGLNGKEERTVDVLNKDWRATRAIYDNSGTSVSIPSGTSTTLSAFNIALGTEILFNYPIDSPYSMVTYPNVVQPSRPMLHEIFAFSIGEQDTGRSSNPSVPANYVVKNIEWKVGGVQRLKSKIVV